MFTCSLLVLNSWSAMTNIFMTNKKIFFLLIRFCPESFSSIEFIILSEIHLILHNFFQLHMTLVVEVCFLKEIIKTADGLGLPLLRI